MPHLKKHVCLTLVSKSNLGISILYIGFWPNKSNLLHFELQLSYPQLLIHHFVIDVCRYICLQIFFYKQKKMQKCWLSLSHHFIKQGFVKQQKKTWNVTPYMWHLTPDTWHLTPEMWHMVGSGHFPKISAFFFSDDLGVIMLWRFRGKGLLNE